MDGTVDTADLWMCPDCSKRFVTANMWHSCGRHMVGQFMEGKGAVAWAYLDGLQEMGASGASGVWEVSGRPGPPMLR
jgi:hypothetical protein